MKFHFNKGQTLDRYTILFQIKCSAYAETYRAKDDGGKLCFLKVIFLSKLKPYQFNFDGEPNEVKIAKCLSNSNICKYVGSGSMISSGQNCAYLVYDFISGETVAQQVTREQGCTVYDMKRVVEGALEALKFLHSRPDPIIHNDITTQNVMLDLSIKPYVPKLIDFGHAQYLSQSGHKNRIIDDDINLFYLAPECLNGAPSVQSDLYSVGIMMYHLLYGITPWFDILSRFQSQDKIDKIFELRERPFKIPNVEIPELSVRLLDIIKKATSNIIEDRFQTADEFIAALKGNDEIVVNQAQHVNCSDNDTEKIASKKRGNGFSDVAGMEGLKDDLRTNVIDILIDTKKSNKYKLDIPNGMLLYGPPGCGKSFIAEKFAEEAGFKYDFIKSSDLASPYVHGSQEKIGKKFDEARKNAPMVLCFDEFDAFVPNRESINNASESGEVNEFLSQMNNCGKDRVFIIATTNRPDLIDPAILRRGRIDKIVYVPVPDFEARKSMFKLYMKDRPFELGIDYDELAKKTERYVSSDIAYIVNSAAKIASKTDSDITQNILDDVIGKTKPSVSNDLIAKYEKMREILEEGVIIKSERKIGFKQ